MCNSGCNCIKTLDDCEQYDILILFDGRNSNGQRIAFNLGMTIERQILLGEERRQPAILLLDSISANKRSLLEGAMLRSTFHMILLTDNFGCDYETQWLIDDVILNSIADNVRPFRLIPVYPERKSQYSKDIPPLGLRALRGLTLREMFRGCDISGIDVDTLTENDLDPIVMDRIKNLLVKHENEIVLRQNQSQALKSLIDSSK